MSYDYNNQNNNNEPNRNSHLGGYPTTQNNDYYRNPTGQPYYQNSSLQAPPPQNDWEPQKRKEKKNGGGGKAAVYVASLLAVGLISGAAGGGITYSMMANSEAAMVQAPATSTETPASSEAATPPTESSVPAATAPANDSPANANGVAGVVEKASVSVVEIAVDVTVNNPFYGQVSGQESGSGVILTADGYIVTNNHVIANAGESPIKVRTEDGTEYEAVLVGTDPDTDLAVLKVDANNLVPVTLADSDEIKVGETAIAIGNPLGTLGGTVTSGIVSALNREITIDNTTMNLIQTSAAVNPGNSGGGLFNENGDLIGIVNAKSSSSSSGTAVEGLGFAIPVNTVKQVTDDIIDHGYVTGRVEYGISVIPIYDTQTAFVYRVNEFGTYIAAVSKDNGLQTGDMIVSINGEEIVDGSEVKNALKDRSVGDTVTFVVKREGKKVTVEVPLTEKIPEYIQQQHNAGAEV